MPPLVFALISVFFSVCGQLMLKQGMNVIARTSGGALPVRMVTSPWVFIGLAVYGCGVLAWIMALSQLELSFVYPFGSLSYVGIMLGSYLLFKENINRTRILGIGVIILGLLIISQS